MYLTHLFTDEEKALREMIRKFTEKEIMPVSAPIVDRPQADEHRARGDSPAALQDEAAGP